MTRKHKPTISKKEQARRQRQNKIIALVSVLIIGGLIFVGLSRRTVYQERFDLDPILGNPDAPVTIIEYASYGCEACQRVHQAGMIEDIIEEYEGQVNFIYRDMPIINPAYDFMTAQLAQCVLDQGNDIFWDFHHMLYMVNNLNTSELENIITSSSGIGVNSEALSSCYYSGKHKDTVRYDQQRGLDLGIRGAPTFFVNGERMYSFNSDAMRQAINNALASL